VTNSSKRVPVYLEIGKKRVLAGALDWPGWCRGGRDGGNALLALLEYGPRYERVLHAAGILFNPPADVHALDVAERLEGNPTTDFGAPDVAPPGDSDPIDDAELQRLQALLKACWTALDAAVEAARGKELRKGPRGGGRELDGILEHVLGAEASYVSRLGGKLPAQSGGKSPGESDRRQAILDALGAAARGELPERGPRGGARWPPRFFVRRAAWHILDHVWEIEDRAL
jgi:hypothetical protein